MSYRQQIRVAEAQIAKLHARVHEAHRSRDEVAWKNAIAELRGYVSPIDDLMDRCYSEQLEDSPDLLRFAIEFLECDPVFFRSGYLKEHLLDRLKSVELREEHRERLRAVLIEAVRHRGHREFRRYCRLAPVLAGDALGRALEELMQSDDGGVRSRAKLMADYIVGRAA